MPAPNPLRGQVAAAYQAGASSVTVGKQFGIAPLTVLRWVRLAGGTVREPSEAIRGSRQIPSAWKEDAARFDAGTTLRELALRRGITKQAMSLRIQRVKAADQPGSALPSEAEIVLAKYVSLGVAAKLLAIDRSTLAAALREGRISGAFRWEGHWVIPKAGIEEYDRRRRERFPHLFGPGS